MKYEIYTSDQSRYKVNADLYIVDEEKVNFYVDDNPVATIKDWSAIIADVEACEEDQEKEPITFFNPKEIVSLLRLVELLK